jgi:mono/diheme cytochrome c family protein
MSTPRANYLYPSIGMGLILASIIFVVVLVPRWTFMARVQDPANAPKDLRGYTQQELRGREVFKREGCWYCHSSVSRPQDWDHGPKSKASDYFYDDYHMLGSERSGPDLANIGGKFPDQYHMLHHQNPRYVKPGSIMPSYSYLSEQELIDLTAYLQGLGPYGTRATDIHSGQLKFAKLIDHTWTNGALKGVSEKIAVWNLTPEEWDKVNAARYEEHAEVPYKYNAEIEELMYGTGHEAQTTKGVLGQLAEASFANEEELEKARHHDPATRSWKEISFKEPEVEPTDPQALKKLQGKRLWANYGKGLFNNQCAPCHGLEGNGKGQAAFGMTKRPANFWEDKFATYTTDTWYWRISRGVPGTQMPRWELHDAHRGGLSPEQRLNITVFLKYISQNKGLAKLKGLESEYGKPPSTAGSPVAAATSTVTK